MPSRIAASASAASKSSAEITPEDVALHVLRRIMRGEFAPGETLPSQAALRAEMAPTLSMTKFNLGMAILKERGFVLTRDRSHSRVADPLPNRGRFAMVLPEGGLHQQVTSLYAVHQHVAQRYLQAHPNQDIQTFYYDARDPHHEDSIAALARQILWHEVAGILFTCILRNRKKFFHEPGIARVLHAYGPQYRRPWMEEFPRTLWADTDPGDFMLMALSRASGAGCRRVAVIQVQKAGKKHQLPNAENPDWFPVLDEVRRLGLETRAEWLLNVGDSAWETARLLCQLPEAPDVVIVADDSLVDPVTAGIASTPKPWPQVIGLANFPVVPTHHVPATFIGFDIEALFEWCMRTLQDPEAQNRAPVYSVKAITEPEWRAGGGIPQKIGTLAP